MQGVHDVHRELWRAHGFCHRSSILCCICHMNNKNTSDPSKMTPHEPLNHVYTMVTSNMVVRRLLSLPNWEPADRKQTKGGRLLIPRGVHFGPGLFPEIVILPNHVGPLVNSIMWQEVPFWTIGPFRAIDSIYFSWLSRGSGIIYCGGSGQVEGVGGFNLYQCA